MSRLSGKLAQAVGKSWENILINVCLRQGYKAIQIHQGCRMLWSSRKMNAIPIKNPFDFIIVGHNRALFLDCKTTKNKKMPPNMIKKHQLEDLSECEKNGFMSGFLVHFRSSENIVFFNASVIKTIGAQSIGEDQGIHIGTINSFNIDLIA